MAPGTTKLLFLGFLLALVVSSSTPAAATNLTLHNLCPYPVWPLIITDSGFPSISNNDNMLRLDGGGRGLISYHFRPSFWAGRVVACTGCPAVGLPSDCETGASHPATEVKLAVHLKAEPEGQDLAYYSVSVVDGFNVPVGVTPHAVGGGQCPALGCAVDLNAGCPLLHRVKNARGVVVACRGPAWYFKESCPLALTTPVDMPVPQRCLAPGELKIVFCQPAIVNDDVSAATAGEAGGIRTVVADN
ncbi:unnamed protein product [Urochloa humidicola]